MSAQMMFYERAVPLSRRRHGGCSVETRDFGFSRHVNSVPLMTVEFAKAAAEYPVVFAGPAGALRPIAMLGLRAEENLFVAGDGRWEGGYVPAFVRRYPFVFSHDAQGRRSMLCVDEAFGGLNREGRGDALFTPAGEPSPYLDQVLRFLQEYRAQFQRTRAFCRRLEELDLLRPMQARASLADGRFSLGGFSTVDRQKLRELGADALASLAANDELELLYLHLQSLRHFEALRHRLSLGQPAAQLPVAPQPAGPVQPVTLH